ncbi:MAG: DciA family protein [Gammaproteobacteria bacterium]|nr:DciA family protein [Gammaproteobacteria bacterium]MDH5630403.1 DciA family protein [Gammaproteobacteria bacterium]
MNRPHFHQIDSLIAEPSGDIKSLLDRLDKIHILNNTLQCKLNATLSKHCRVVNVRQNILVIAADSAAWATKLRYQVTDLLSFFRQSGYVGLGNIEIIIKPK